MIAPGSDRIMTLRRAVDLGVFDLHTGDMHDLINHSTLSFPEAVFQGYIPPLGLSRPGRIPWLEALERGLLDLDNQTFTDPTSRLKMDIDTALKLEYVLPEEWGIELPIYLDKAIELGLADLEENTFRHPHTGEVMSLIAAIAFGYVIAPEDWDDGDGIDFEDAWALGLIDTRRNTFKEPVTEVLMPLDAAIRQKFLKLPRKPIKMFSDGRVSVNEPRCDMAERAYARHSSFPPFANNTSGGGRALHVMIMCVGGRVNFKVDMSHQKKNILSMK